MNSFPDFLSSVLLRIFRLAMMVMLAIFVACFLLLGLGVALASVVWSLLRGRKPAMFTVFQYFHQASKQFGQGPWTGRAPERSEVTPDIVDVQAHEVAQSLVEYKEPLRK